MGLYELLLFSQVFRAMFECNMVEAESGRAKIEDVEPAVMEQLVHFAYTGRVLLYYFFMLFHNVE